VSAALVREGMSERVSARDCHHMWGLLCPEWEFESYSKCIEKS
jgi:hypothetical protein